MYPVDYETGKRQALSFKVALMPGTGHFVMMEDPATFNKLLHETLEEIMWKGAREI
jgi:pimeloyl-ACP methyl ester carboxylesterase